MWRSLLWCTTAVLATTSPPDAQTTVENQGRFTAFVADANGDPVTSADVEIRPMSAPTPGNAIDMTHHGGGLWYVTQDVDIEEFWQLYVDNAAADPDSIQIGNGPGSVVTVSIANDAVTPAKIDDDASFVFNPSTSSPAVDVDMTTSNPSSGIGVRVTSGSNTAAGLQLDGSTTGEALLVNLSDGSGNGIEVTDIGNTRRSALVVNSPTATTGSGLQPVVDVNTFMNNAVGVDVFSSGANASYGFRAFMSGFASGGAGVRSEAFSSSRAFWGSSSGAATLYLTSAANADSTIYVDGGHVEIRPDPDTSGGSGFPGLSIVHPGNSDQPAMTIDMNAATADDVGLKIFNGNSGTVQRALWLQSVSTGAASAALHVENKNENVVGQYIYSDANSKGIGLFINSGTLEGNPVGTEDEALIVKNTIGSASDVALFQSLNDKSAIRVDDNSAATPGDYRAGVEVTTSGTSAFTSGVSIDVESSSSATDGLWLKLGSAHNGQAIRIDYDGNTTGQGLFFNYPNGATIANSIIDIDQGGNAWITSAPVIDIDVTQTTTAAVRLDAGSSGTAIEVTGSATAFKATDGHVDLRNPATDILYYKTQTSGGGIGFQSSTYFNASTGQLFFHDGTQWLSTTLSPGGMPRGAAYADTLAVEFGNGDVWAGTGCTKWGGVTIYVTLSRVGYAGSDFCTCSSTLIPSLEGRETVEVHALISSSGSAGNNQVITAKLSAFGAGEGWDSWTYTDKDTLTMVANAQDPVAHTWTFDVSADATTDRILVLGFERNSGDGGDTDTSQYTYIHPGGFLLVY